MSLQMKPPLPGFSAVCSQTHQLQTQALSQRFWNQHPHTATLKLQTRGPRKGLRGRSVVEWGQRGHRLERHRWPRTWS